MASLRVLLRSNHEVHLGYLYIFFLQMINDASFITKYLVLWHRYTSFTGLFPLLSRGQLLLVKVEEISQTIDAESFTVQNSVQFSGPLASSSISASAKFEVRSPRRVQVCCLCLSPTASIWNVIEPYRTKQFFILIFPFRMSPNALRN